MNILRFVLDALFCKISFTRILLSAYILFLSISPVGASYYIHKEIMARVTCIPELNYFSLNKIPDSASSKWDEADILPRSKFENLEELYSDPKVKRFLENGLILSINKASDAYFWDKTSYVPHIHKCELPTGNLVTRLVVTHTDKFNMKRMSGTYGISVEIDFNGVPVIRSMMGIEQNHHRVSSIHYKSGAFEIVSAADRHSFDKIDSFILKLKLPHSSYLRTDSTIYAYGKICGDYSSSHMIRLPITEIDIDTANHSCTSDKYRQQFYPRLLVE